MRIPKLRAPPCTRAEYVDGSRPIWPLHLSSRAPRAGGQRTRVKCSVHPSRPSYTQHGSVDCTSSAPPGCGYSLYTVLQAPPHAHAARGPCRAHQPCARHRCMPLIGAPPPPLSAAAHCHARPHRRALKPAPAAARSARRRGAARTGPRAARAASTPPPPAGRAARTRLCLLYESVPRVCRECARDRALPRGRGARVGARRALARGCVRRVAACGGVWRRRRREDRAPSAAATADASLATLCAPVVPPPLPVTRGSSLYGWVRQPQGGRYGEIWGDMGSLRAGYANLRAGGRYCARVVRAPREDNGEEDSGYSGVRVKTAESVSSRALAGVQEPVFRF